MLRCLSRLKHGHRAIDERALALNLSFVLHERSDSAAVRSAVRAVRRHASIVGHLDRASLSLVNAGDNHHPDVTLWLTATVGLPQLLADALSVSPDRILNADSGLGSPQPVDFFRAPANLNLPPDDLRRIGVAALILRPDRRTSQLVVTGVHNWPDDHRGALRSLERLVQAHAGQWMAPRALWPASAEELLPDEVY